MSTSIPSRPGADQLGSDPKELMLELFGGEVLTAFQTNTRFRATHQVKTLAGGKLFKFPAIWRTTAEYHVPGTEILGKQIPHTEITVSPDDKLIASVFVADIDEIMNHYDIRAPYTTELGAVLARFYDKNVARTILQAARSGALFTGDQGGTVLKNADFATDPSKLFDGISMAKETMDIKDVPIDTMPVYASVKTPLWYQMARSDRNLNKDRNGGSASDRKHTLETIDDIQIIKSNNTPFGENSVSNPVSEGATLPEKYRLNATNTVGMVWTPYAAATAEVQGLSSQLVDQPEKQGTLMLSRLMTGSGVLRSKCAVELASGDNA